MALGKNSAAGRILHNSFWYGLETLLETIVFLGTSIAVARYLGPEQLGYFTYINLFIVTVTRASGSGISGATRKYMSEYLAEDRPGMARAVYHLAFRYQLIGALVFTAFGIAGIVLFGEPGYRIMASILIISIIPGLLSWIPAAANSSFEDVAPNTISAFGYLVAYAVVIVLTLTLDWGLIGIASAQLLGRCIEVALRTRGLRRRLHALPLDRLEPEFIQRIRKFCVEALGIQLLMSVVWDRSEMLFLRHFASLTQIGFYSVSFGLTNNLLVVPRTFSAATGLTLMVESGRDPARVDGIVKSACRYLLLVVFPGASGSGRGHRARHPLRLRRALRRCAIPVLIIASLLAMPRAFQEIPETLLRAADRQKRMLRPAPRHRSRQPGARLDAHPPSWCSRRRHRQRLRSKPSASSYFGSKRAAPTPSTSPSSRPSDSSPPASSWPLVAYGDRARLAHSARPHRGHPHRGPRLLRARQALSRARLQRSRSASPRSGIDLPGPSCASPTRGPLAFVTRLPHDLRRRQERSYRLPRSAGVRTDLQPGLIHHLEVRRPNRTQLMQVLVVPVAMRRAAHVERRALIRQEHTVLLQTPSGSPCPPADTCSRRSPPASAAGSPAEAGPGSCRSTPDAAPATRTPSARSAA